MDDFVTLDVRRDKTLVGTHGHELRSDAESVRIGMFVRKAVGSGDDTRKQGGSDVFF